MKLSQRLKTCLVLPILISFVCSSAIAEKPSSEEPLVPIFTQLEEDQPSPFKAWCFNESASARIIGALEFAQKKCAVQIQVALEKEKAIHDLMVGNLNLRINTTEEEYKTILIIKNEEIERLSAAALKRPNDYTHWWGIGGFIVGAASVVILIMTLDAGDGVL
jgi:hypothetical protein